MKIARHSEKVTKNSFEKMAVTAAETASKGMDAIDVTQMASGTLQPEAQSATQMLMVAMREYCVVKDTSFNELEDLHKLEIGSTLHQNVNLLLADPLSNTRNARGQASSTHDVLSKEDVNDAVKFMSNIV